MTTRADIVAAARSLLGTPYATHQRQPGVGVDCIGLVIVVARLCGLKAPDFDINGYSAFPDGSMIALCGEHLDRKRESQMQPGDVVVVSWGDDRAHHIGIAAPHSVYPGRMALIHAYPKSGKVVEHRLAFDNFMRHAGTYSFRDIS